MSVFANCLLPNDPTVFTHATACPGKPFLSNTCEAHTESIPWNITRYCNQTSFFQGSPTLPEYTGWALVLGMGIMFSFLVSCLVWVDNRILRTEQNAEHFSTAGRSMKTGMTANSIVSQWTWAATLLQSSNVAYQYGLSGPLWYASGASIQIVFFAVLAIEIKRKVPNAHTMCEIVLARWGYTAHKIFIVFAFMCNLIVTSMTLVGAGAATKALTGGEEEWPIFLIPVSVLAYTAYGGLKATYFASYIHNFIILTIISVFVFVVFWSDSDIGSAEKMYKNLKELSYLYPRVEGNANNSFLTTLSTKGFFFGIINIIGNFGTVFVDQSYWQAAIAANPKAATRGFILGGIVWFAVPFALGTALGLSAVAMDLPVTLDEAKVGLVPPAAAVHLLGKTGAFIMLVMLFNATTSTTAVELVALSNILVHDIYKVYISPDAGAEDLLKWSRRAVVMFGLLMAGFAMLLQSSDVSLGWIYNFMGIMIGSAVIPCSYLLLWMECTATAAITGATGGWFLGLFSWLFVAYNTSSGEITFESTGNQTAMLVGNLMAIFSSIAITTLGTVYRPNEHDFENMGQIQLVGNVDPISFDETEDELRSMKNCTLKGSGVYAVVILFVVPLLTYLHGVYVERSFKVWVVLSICWLCLGAITIIVMPVWESFGAIKVAVHRLWKLGCSRENNSRQRAQEVSCAYVELL